MNGKAANPLSRPYRTQPAVRAFSVLPRDSLGKPARPMGSCGSPVPPCVASPPNRLRSALSIGSVKVPHPPAHPSGMKIPDIQVRNTGLNYSPAHRFDSAQKRRILPRTFGKITEIRAWPVELPWFWIIIKSGQTVRGADRPCKKPAGRCRNP